MFKIRDASKTVLVSIGSVGDVQDSQPARCVILFFLAGDASGCRVYSICPYYFGDVWGMGASAALGETGSFAGLLPLQSSPSARITCSIVSILSSCRFADVPVIYRHIESSALFAVHIFHPRRSASPRTELI
jgi:hypothetical protein